MPASSDGIDIRAISIKLSPAAQRPRGWIDFTMFLDSKPLDRPVGPGMNRALRIDGSFHAKSPAGLADILHDALGRNRPDLGIGWRLEDAARRGLWRRPGYSREDVEALEAKIECVLADAEAALP